MTYELKITTKTKEELIAFLGGVLEAVPAPTDKELKTTPTVTETPTPTVTATVAEPAQAKQYSVDEIARACAPLMDTAEGMRMLQELLAYYGAKSLKDLDKAQYGDFVIKLDALGVAV